MISEETYLKMTDGLELMALTNLWYSTKNYEYFGFPKVYSETYVGRIKLFFIIIRRLIEENKLRLAENGEFLKGTIDEQLELFKNAFPDEERMKEVDVYWWFLDDCPAGGVWIIAKEVNRFTTPAENGKFYYWV